MIAPPRSSRAPQLACALASTCVLLALAQLPAAQAIASSTAATGSTPAATRTLPLPASATSGTATTTIPAQATTTQSATPAPGTSTAPATPAAKPRRSSGEAISNAALAAAIVAALAILCCLAWGVARMTSFEPRWLQSLRHSLAEASYRTSATLAEFGDWMRLGR